MLTRNVTVNYKMMTKKYIFGLILLLLFYGCEKDHNIENINSDIIITLWENLENSGRSFELKCETEEEYPCCNYSILNDFSINYKSISINFKKISKPEVCLTAFGPAKAYLNFGYLANDTYDLEIKVINRKSYGKLTVTDNYYSIDLYYQKKIQLTQYTLNRIPQNTIWGTIEYYTNTSSNLAQSFIDSLQILGATSKTYNSGEYGYFNINSSGSIEPPQNHGYYLIKPYIFEYRNNMDSLKTLVSNYGINYGDSLSIILYNDKGEKFMSWVN